MAHAKATAEAIATSFMLAVLTTIQATQARDKRVRRRRPASSRPAEPLGRGFDRERRGARRRKYDARTCVRANADGKRELRARFRKKSSQRCQRDDCRGG